MNFAYLNTENNVFIDNIFKIKKNIIDISKFNTKTKTKQVTFSNINNYTIIPSRNEIIDNNLKYVIWYSVDEFKLMKASFIYEMNIKKNSSSYFT